MQWVKLGGAWVLAPAQKAKAAPARKVGRYTRFGWRLGHANGPWETGDAALCAERDDLVANKDEQAIMDRILRECDGLGSSAGRLARQLREDGVRHPRTGKPWRAGSIMMIYGTHRRHREQGLMNIIATAMANQVHP